MEYIYAALLLHKLGKEVTEDALSSVIKAAGVSVDSSKVKSLVASLKGVDIESELANVSLATSSAKAPAAAAEEKKEEAPKEEKHEAAAEGLSALFG